MVGVWPQVVVMSKGYVIYHGPVSEAVGYFASVGYHKPDFMDPADFLASVSIVYSYCLSRSRALMCNRESIVREYRCCECRTSHCLT
eukprot:48507-Eustigmatos_ZCMA.PRE.1